MRFLTRGLAGLALFAVAGLLVALGTLRLVETLTADPPAPQAARERVYAAPVARLTPETVAPRLTAFGEVRAWRTLQLRAGVGGRVVDLHPDFRDGARAAAGDLLFRIDPADFENRVDSAEAALAEARADAAEARAAVRSAEIEAESAETQAALRRSALERQRDLARRGVASAAVVDESELALAAAEQAVASRAQAVVTARLRVERADLAVARAELTVAEARRRLADTETRAPFDGVLTGVSAALGDIAGANETLGALVDPAALDVAFDVSNAAFARLLGEGGRLQPLPATVTLDLGDAALTIPATLDRADGAVGAGRTGRTLFARLDTAPDTVLRPGDFVTVTLTEPPLENVAVIPAAAATEDGRILLVAEDGRLTETQVRILRRQGAELIVADAPFGATFVAERAPQLALGLAIRPVWRDAPPAPDSVALDPARRQALRDYVTAHPSMPDARRAELLTILDQPEAPREVIERLEDRMGARG